MTLTRTRAIRMLTSLQFASRMLLVGAFLALPAARAAPEEPPATAAAAVVEDHYPAQVVNFKGGITGYGNLIFESLPGYRPLTLDVYTRASDHRRRPLIVYVHGGGWLGGQSRNSGAFVDFPAVLSHLAHQGYAVASVSYRLSGEARFPAAIQDVKLAVRWLRAHAADYGIDPEHVIIWGASAGGQLAGLVATSCDNPALAPVIPQGPDVAALNGASDCVQGAVLWYGALDFTQSHPGSQTPEAQYLGCDPKACEQTVSLASPALQVSERTPPVLLAFGSADQTVSPDQSHRFHERMVAAGRPCEVLELPGIGHSFIGADAAATHAASLTALKATFQFFHRIAPPVS